jgi:hypothetical protein
MKRIVTHLLVAAGLATGAVGAAQAHTDLHVGLWLGAPAYVQPAPVYVQPAPYYRAPPPVWRHRDEPRWGGPDRGRWNRTGWDRGHGGDYRGAWGRPG